MDCRDGGDLRGRVGGGAVSRPRLLDLFCGAGGAAMGYYRAGFEVVGVDIKPQPHYPFEFIQMDALQALDVLLLWSGEISSSDHAYQLRAFDAIHASPPCQLFTALNALGIVGGSHLNLIPETRERLESSRSLWVIENVPGAPLINPLMLCGMMFGLPLFRHRLFEISIPYLQPGHTHGKWRTMRSDKRPGMPSNGERTEGKVWLLAGRFAGVERARIELEMQWMTRDEMR